MTITEAAQISNYWASALIILQITIFPSNASGAFAQDSIYTSFYSSVSEPLVYVGFPYICK